MGVLISRQINSWFGARPVKICLIGLDAAGKTSLLYKLHLGENVVTIPTIGFNVEKVSYKNLSMTIWDVGGQDRLRTLWHHYYEGADGVIFLVDSADAVRFPVAATELAKVLSSDSLQDVPLLVYANKQDLPSARAAGEVSAALGMQKMRNRQWFVQGCSATEGSGVFEGLDWMSTAVKSRPPRPTA
eukprot:TRINITY_DN47001_c0_g1_i1.p2 TRINITY_DN47001_c0_g1~~TRINITY_DN47001_c0_g1_i1.p2  ORF type:complete len:187 (+),score=27.21 TRINITY_DN47001_c0_g1_i1:183-743(+)